MRGVIFGLILAAVAAGAAQAGEYVVVASTDAAFPPGLELDSGARLGLPAGQTLTLIHASGSVTTLRGSAAGAMVPTRRATEVADANRLIGLKAMVGPPPTGRTFGGRRGGVCQPASALVTLDQILAARSGGCEAQAKTALETYVAQAGGEAKAAN